MAISLNPTSFLEGGGLIDDIDARITEARFVIWDYNGAPGARETLAAKLNLVDADGATHEQYYSAGDPKFFVPTNDGKEVESVGTRQALTKGSNLAELVQALANVGFDVSLLDAGDISVIEGVNAHWNRVAQPERKGGGIYKDEGESKRQGPRTLLVPTKLLTGAAAKGKPAAKAAQASKPAAAASAAPKAQVAASTNGQGQLDDTIKDAIIGMLAAAPDGILRKDISKLLFSSDDLKALPAKDKAAAVKRAFEVEFLETGPWQFDPDSGTISL